MSGSDEVRSAKGRWFIYYPLKSCNLPLAGEPRGPFMSSNTRATENKKAGGPRLLNTSIVALLGVLLAIVLNETAFYFGQTELALRGHLVTLLGSVLVANFIRNDSGVFIALAFLPLFRLVTLGMPVFVASTLLWLALVYGSLLPSFYFLAKIFRRDETELGRTPDGGPVSDGPRNPTGLDFVDRVLYWVRSWLSRLGIIRPPATPLALGWRMALLWTGPGAVIGILLAEIEYTIINPTALIPEWSVVNLLFIGIVMICFVGFVEELLFRGVVQPALEARLGRWPGLLVTSGLFGVMHSGYGLPRETYFAVAVGLIFGWVYDRTNSVLLVTIMHGTLNTVLFGVIPLRGPLLTTLF